MNPPESDDTPRPGERGYIPPIIEVEGREDDSHFGKGIVCVVVLSTGALLAKSVPWITPIWLGAILVAAVVADFVSVCFASVKRHQLSAANVYKLVIRQKPIYAIDDAALKNLVLWPELFLPVVAAIFAAFITAGFTWHLQAALPLRWPLTNWHLVFVEAMTVAAIGGGIFGAVLIARTVLRMRFRQTILLGRNLPCGSVQASALFITAVLLALYVFGDFAWNTYSAFQLEARRKVPYEPLFTQLSRLGDIEVQHRRNLLTTSPSNRELVLVDRNSRVVGSLVHRYERAAAVTFSPDEGNLIISEKKGGTVVPLVFYTRRFSAQWGRANYELFTPPSLQRGGLPEAVRAFYRQHSPTSLPPGNIRIAEWAKSRPWIIFAVDRKSRNSKEDSLATWLCAWDYKIDRWMLIDAKVQDATGAIAFLLEEEERQAKEVTRIAREQVQQVAVQEKEKFAPRQPEATSPPVATKIEAPTVQPKLAARATPKPLLFPEGKWSIHQQARSPDGTLMITVAGEITVRGTSFRYDNNTTWDVIDMKRSAPGLRGMKRVRFTRRYTGVIVRSNEDSFAVKVTGDQIVNRSAPNIPTDHQFQSSVGAAWIFGNSNGNIFDQTLPGTVFRKEQ